MGAHGPLVKLLQVVLPLALGAHQGQVAQPDAVGLVVDHTYAVASMIKAINVTLAQL
jgi:hypothetical protein